MVPLTWSGIGARSYFWGSKRLHQATKFLCSIQSVFLYDALRTLLLPSCFLILFFDTKKVSVDTFHCSYNYKPSDFWTSFHLERRVPCAQFKQSKADSRGNSVFSGRPNVNVTWTRAWFTDAWRKWCYPWVPQRYTGERCFAGFYWFPDWRNYLQVLCSKGD